MASDVSQSVSSVVDSSQIEDINSMSLAYQNLTEKVKGYNLNLDFVGQAEIERIERIKSMTQSFEQVGDSISRAIAADESLGKSMAAVGATIIEELEKQALAAIIRNAALSSANPFLAIAGAIAGFSIIKGLFAKLSKNKDGQSSSTAGSGYVSGRAATYMSVQVRQRGTDLVGVGVEENRIRKRTRG